MYEYDVQIHPSKPDDLQAYLNKQAKAGWRLHTLEAVTKSQVRLVFERTVKSDSSSKTTKSNNANRAKPVKGSAQ